MHEKATLVEAIDLDRLDDYLVSDRSPIDCMGLSALDGFLTGLVIGPQFILPNEWLPVIWGGAEPNFESEAEMRAVLDTIMGRYKQIVVFSHSASPPFEPIFLEGPDGEVTVADWAGGFLHAVALRGKAWEPLVKHHQGRTMLMPFFSLSGYAELDAKPNGAPHEDECHEEVPHIILACVAGVHRFWKNVWFDAMLLSSRGRSRPGCRR